MDEKQERFSERSLMELAISLARQSVSEPGHVSPKVGAVAASDGYLLGAAFRGELNQGEHAEFTLLEQKLSDTPLAGSTLFTTLEPCTSRNSPKVPCVERIIERRIRRVVIGVLDPNDEIRGRGELRLREAGIEVTRFDPDLMAQIEELNRDFARAQIGLGLQRSTAETTDPVEAGAVGPNGFPIGYTPQGDKVEWIPSDDDDDPEPWPMLLRRNDEEILRLYNEFWDKVSWNRRQVRLEKLGQEDETDADETRSLQVPPSPATQVVDSEGREYLGWSDFEWGLLQGRMSALSWVLGASWDESLDT